MDIISETSCRIPHFPSSDIFTSSILALSAELLPKTAATLWTNLSVIQSYNWFFQLTRFEAIFFGLVLMHFVIGNAIGILPLRINSLFSGSPNSGVVKRKRRSMDQVLKSIDKIIDPVLRIVEQADHEKCFLRTLCEIQHKISYEPGTYHPSKDVQIIINGLQRTLKYDRDSDSGGIDKPMSGRQGFQKVQNSLQVFQEAVETGMKAIIEPDANLKNTTTGMTACSVKYHQCSLQTDDIFHYLHVLDDNWYRR